MASRLAEIYKSEKKTGGGLGSSIGKSLKEKIDPRQMLDQSGLLVSMFPSLKSFKAIPSKKLSESFIDGKSVDNSILSSIAATSSLTAKNSMSLPMMARDMNLMKSNIFKLVKLQGGTANTNKTDVFWKNSKIRDSAYENTIGKISGKGMVGKMAKSVFVGKQNRDGQSSDKALYVTGAGGAGEEDRGIKGFIKDPLGALGAGSTIKSLATLASSVITSPIFLASAAALGTVALAKKLRDDEIASNPEKYKDVASVRAKREGVTNKTAGTRNAAEARAGSLTQGDADEIIKTLIKEKLFGISAESFIREYYPKNPEITLQTILNICDTKLKEEYQKMVAVNMPPTPVPSPTPASLPISPAGAGRGLVNPENVSPTPQTQPEVPSNVIRSGSGAPIMTGSGGYVTSGEPMTTPSSTTPTRPSSTTPTQDLSIGDAINNAAATTGVSAQTLAIFGQLESGLGKFVENKLSSAKGPFQFIDSTWLAMMKKYGKKYGYDPSTLSEKDQLNLRFNNRLSALMAAEYTKENAATLKLDSSDPTNVDKLYLAHFLGPGGAKRVLSGEGLSEKQKESVLKYNPNIKTGSKEEFLQFAQGKTSQASKVSAVQQISGTPSTGTAVASASTSVADAKMAAMTPSSGNTNVINKPTNVASNAPSSGGKASTAYDNELFQTLVGLQSVSA